MEIEKKEKNIIILEYFENDIDLEKENSKYKVKIKVQIINNLLKEK
jgi:hypothetical protein